MANDYSQDYLFPPIAISDLPQAIQAKRTDTLEVNQDGTSKQITVGLINDLAAAGSAPAGPAGGDLAGFYPDPKIKTSVTLLGSPVTTTQPNATSNTTVATTAFVKNQNYLTSTSLNGYLPLTGGTLTGPLTGTSASMSGAITSTGGNISTTGGSLSTDRGGDATFAQVIVRSDPGQTSSLDLQSTATARWSIRKNATAESGSNVGSDLQITASSDAGSFLSTPLTITRSTGAVILTGTLTGTTAAFGGEITAATPATADSDTTVATTAFVKAQGYATASNYLPLAGGTLTGPVAGTSMTLSTAIPLTDNDTSVATTGWVKSAVGVSVGAAPPGTPFDGQLWFNTDAVSGGGKLYIRYNDGNTTQWVPVA